MPNTELTIYIEANELQQQLAAAVNHHPLIGQLEREEEGRTCTGKILCKPSFVYKIIEYPYKVVVHVEV